MILIFKNQNKKVATNDWTVEEDPETDYVIITYPRGVSRVFIAETAKIAITFKDFTQQLLNSEKTGICNIAHIPGVR